LTAQTFKGFLLTRNWRDTRDGVELEFWFASEQGPLRAVVRGEHSVFFLAQSELARAREILGSEPGVEVREVALRNFHMEAVAGLYFTSYRQARRWADALRNQGLEPLEADINPADRFLMERFVAGAALLRGEPRPAGRHLVLDNPAMKTLEYRPALKVVSYDIETAMAGAGCSCWGRARSRTLSTPSGPRNRCCRPFWTG
jgi:DNA polymerase-2